MKKVLVVLFVVLALVCSCSPVAPVKQEEKEFHPGVEYRVVIKDTHDQMVWGPTWKIDDTKLWHHKVWEITAPTEKTFGTVECKLENVEVFANGEPIGKNEYLVPKRNEECKVDVLLQYTSTRVSTGYDRSSGQVIRYRNNIYQIVSMDLSDYWMWMEYDSDATKFYHVNESFYTRTIDRIAYMLEVTDLFGPHAERTIVE